MTTPGNVLKKRRETAGLSQQGLATKLGMSMPAVSQWERGIVTPRREVAEKLDAALSADGEIMTAFGYAPPSDTAAELMQRLDRIEALVRSLEQGQARLVKGQTAGLETLYEILNHRLPDAAATPPPRRRAAQ